MTTLAKDNPRVFERQGDVPVFNELKVVASDIIYAGAAVTKDNSGNARPLNTADTENGFAGFCVQKADNSSGSAGDIRVKVQSKGYVELDVTGVSSEDHEGDAVYATDDDTFTLTASGGLRIGTVFRWDISTTCIVYFESLALRSI